MPDPFLVARAVYSMTAKAKPDIERRARGAYPRSNRRFMRLRSRFATLFRVRMAAAAACALLAGPAAAQMYPGDNVTVNPNVGTRVLLYPDGKHIRVVPPRPS